MTQIFIILLIMVAFGFGCYDGGNITAAVVFAAIFGPEVFRT